MLCTSEVANYSKAITKLLCVDWCCYYAGNLFKSRRWTLFHKTIVHKGVNSYAVVFLHQLEMKPSVTKFEIRKFFANVSLSLQTFPFRKLKHSVETVKRFQDPNRGTSFHSSLLSFLFLTCMVVWFEQWPVRQMLHVAVPCGNWMHISMEVQQHGASNTAMQSKYPSNKRFLHGTATHGISGLSCV